MPGANVRSGGRSTITLHNSPIKVKEIKFSGPKISLKAKFFAIGTGSGPSEIDKSVPNPEWDYEISRRILEYTPGNIMKGDDVKKLQKALIDIGISVGPRNDDGEYGRNTKKGVITFQKRFGLYPDGQAGPEVRDALGLSGPAAYKKDTQFTVEVKFKSSDPSITSAEIWAVGGKDSFGRLGKESAPDQNVLVTFNNGVSTGGSGNGFYPFKIKTKPTSILTHYVKWLWKCKNINGKPSRMKSMGTSHHYVYITYDNPKTSIESAPHPIQCMRWACKWANKKSKINDIAKEVHRYTCTHRPPYFNRSTVYTGGTGCTIIWHMMKSKRHGTSDPYAGSCSAYANLIVHACALLGIDGKVKLVAPVVADPNFKSITGQIFKPTITQSGLDSKTEKTVTLANGPPPIVIKALVFTKTHASNQYEGCAVINRLYYGGNILALGNKYIGISSKVKLMYEYCDHNGRYPVWYSRTTGKYYGKDILSPTVRPGNTSQEILRRGLKLNRTLKPTITYPASGD